MNKLIILVLALTSCYHSNKPKVEFRECVITEIEERAESTLNIKPRYTFITDCGDTITLNDCKYHLGETIFIQKNYYHQN